MAEIALNPQENLFITGDALIRYENHDTTRPGTRRQERIRLSSHLVLGYRPNENTTLKVGSRTGALDNQQTPTLTLKQLDNNHGYGRRSYYVDRWELEYKKEHWHLLLGRSPWPFWAATDNVWDGDVNPAGVYAAHSWVREGQQTTFSAAWFALPDGALSFTGYVGTAQIQHQWPLGEGRVSSAFQWLQFEGEAPAKFPRARNHERDYGIGLFSLAYQQDWMGEPFSAGFDLFRNFRSYGADDAFGFANRDENTGFGLALSWGKNKQAGDWRLRYRYTHQETLSVNPSISEDTFTRLGTSNYKGHDFRVIYSLMDNLTLMVRYIDSREIVDQARADRFRIDTKITF